MIKNELNCLKSNAPFEEISEKTYFCLFEEIPPKNWCRPFENGGWFFCGEPHSRDTDTGALYHCLCIKYNGRYYAGLRNIRVSIHTIEREITSFFRKIDESNISLLAARTPFAAKGLSKA